MVDLAVHWTPRPVAGCGTSPNEKGGVLNRHYPAECLAGAHFQLLAISRHRPCGMRDGCHWSVCRQNRGNPKRLCQASFPQVAPAEELLPASGLCHTPSSSFCRRLVFSYKSPRQAMMDQATLGGWTTNMHSDDSIHLNMEPCDSRISLRTGIALTCQVSLARHGALHSCSDKTSKSTSGL